jgi:hypothetical protein
MPVEPHNKGIVRQRQLSDFLYAELLHTLGAYRLAREKFTALEEELKKDALADEERDVAGAVTVRSDGEADEGAPGADSFLLEACAQAIRCNRGLQVNLHKPGTPRHPSPDQEDEEPEFKPDLDLLEAVASFYDVVIEALRFEPAPSSSQSDEDEGGLDPALRLKRLLSVVHDPQRRGEAATAQTDFSGRITRMEDRRRRVENLRFETERRHPGTPVVLPETAFADLVEDHIQKEESLHVTILRAMSEAHHWMHVAEHLRRKCFGEMFTSIPDTHVKTQQMLRYSEVLNTFVFVAAKVVPWVFAENRRERDALIGSPEAFKANCFRLTPTYCLWTATQFSMLALHRRAFTSWTMGRHDRAYRDFHKLTRLLKGLREPAEKRAVRVPGTRTFIGGMTAMAELHTGRIYRGQHAHRMALRYFERSSRHLKGWEEHGEIGEIITNSHWRIDGLINEAKAHYELGRIKHSLLNYVYAWCAFLRLADSESHATANVDIVQDFINWLEPIVDEPEMSRVDLRERIRPLVEQFDTLRSPKHLELLAADIVMRIGHLLYVLKLPPAGWEPNPERKRAKSNHDLAYKCVLKAAHLDPTSTLIASDLLKIEADSASELSGEPPAPIKLREHWPAGSGKFEESARVIEYTLHRWLAEQRPGDKKPEGEAEEHEMHEVGEKEQETLEPERQVARKLLNSFLAHTDSSNVKLAQVYRYLMRPVRARRRRTPSDQRTLDFVCLRRYSSFFPFLPRPSAFRAPGGGYFVHVREPGKDAEPFGIAVDPGPDFIENLYRCGYGLADLHMIVLTHDHADHMASLDALLALLGHRRGLGDSTFHPDGGRLPIVGNESIVKRYEFYDPPNGDPARHRDAVALLSFDDIARITNLEPADREDDRQGERLLELPPALRVEPVRSWGHLDAAGHVSQAFLLSMGEVGGRSTILFTGDTGLPPEPEEDPRYAAGEKTLMEAVDEADVVVAHLSAVPLKELRELAGLKPGEAEPAAIGEFTELWEEARAQTEQEPSQKDEDLKEGIDQAAFLLRQLQFGFRSRPTSAAPDLSVSPFSSLDRIRKQPEQHLYLNGLMEIAKRLRDSTRQGPPPLLLIGELREELGTFRTRIAARISKAIFRPEADRGAPAALTADIGLRVRLAHPASDHRGGACPLDSDDRGITVLCTTCDLDNDLVPGERFHRPGEVREVCVKGEDEGVFYNCLIHDPAPQPGNQWLEAVERFEPFGE